MRVEARRTLSLHEHAGLLDLWVESWAAAMPQINFMARRNWFGDHLTALLKADAELLLLRSAKGEVAGFATLDAVSGEIDQLVVATRFQGGGLARRLLDEAKARSPGHLQLSVNQNNARAVALYRSAGFNIIGETVNARSGLKVWTMSWGR